MLIWKWSFLKNVALFHTSFQSKLISYYLYRKSPYHGFCTCYTILHVWINISFMSFRQNLETDTNFVLQKILKALDRVTENRTTIVIAHRLSTVISADEILVLDEGRIAERGPHWQLLADPESLYADLWNKQHQAAIEGLRDEQEASKEGAWSRVRGCHLGVDIHHSYWHWSLCPT